MKPEPLPAPKVRYESVDLAKGVLTLKMAVAHTAFFVAWSGFYHATDVGMIFNFPTLLFAFGLGTGFSTRRKPAWPLVLLAISFVVGSIANEALLERYRALGLTNLTPFPGSVWDRALQYVTLADSAHLTDFLPPYIFALTFALIADRISRPMRLWSWQTLVLVAAGFYLAGRSLDALDIGGPLSVFWNKGFCAMQWFCVFVAGLLVARYAPRLLAIRPPSWRNWAIIAVRLAALTAAAAYLAHLEPRNPDLPTRFAWRHALYPDLPLVAMLSGLLMVGLAADLASILPRAFIAPFIRLGRRTLMSLAVQFFTMPLMGVLALQFPSTPARIAIGVAWLVSFAAVMFNWDWLAHRARTVLRRRVPRLRPGIATRPAHPHAIGPEAITSGHASGPVAPETSASTSIGS